MIVTSDGIEITTYLEGVRIPALSLVVRFQRLYSTATLGIFADKTAKGIKEGSLLMVFFKKSGLKTKRLLYIGYLSAISYQKTDGMETISLSFISRIGFLSSTLVSLSGQHTANSAVTQAYDSNAIQGTNNQREYNSNIARGHGMVNLNVAMSDSTNNNVGTSNLTTSQVDSTFENFQSTNPADSIKSKSKSDLIVEDSTIKFSPNSEKWSQVDYNEPIKSFMEKLMADAYNSSGSYNHLQYKIRLLLETYLQELPGGWTEYIFGKGLISDNGSKITNKTSFAVTINQYLNKMGGDASIADILRVLSELLLMEVFEIPGIVDKALAIMPDSMYSDIPMCNIVWPENTQTITYTEDFSQKTTRLIFNGALMNSNLPGETVAKNTGSATVSNARGMYPMVYKIINEAGKEAIDKNYGGLLFENEVYSGTHTYMTQFPIRYLLVTNAKVLSDLAKYAFKNISTRYSGCDINMHFNPNIVPGFRTLINDGMWLGTGKAVSVVHSFSQDGSASTTLKVENYEKLEDYKYTIPMWYSPIYQPKNIAELYKQVLGSNSIGGYLGKEGVPLKDLVKELNELYDKATLKGYMGEKLSQRYMLTEEEVFAKYAATASQQDEAGVIIYTAKVFDEVDYDGYSLDGVAMQLKSDRQKAVLNYIKASYGRPAIKV